MPTCWPALWHVGDTLLMDELRCPAYRIEHRRGHDASLILAFGDEAPFPQLTLAPAAKQLLAAGETGQVVLIDQATEAIVARRHLVRRGVPGRP